MRQLTSFSNIHQNQKIVVCGCGWSLNELEQPERFVTIGVNDVGRKFQPDYLIVVNPREQFSGDRFRFVENSAAKHLFTQLNLGVALEKTVKFRLGKFGGTDFSDRSVLHYTNNSPYIAVCLAIYMGARRVGLIGVDFTDNHFFGSTGKHPLNSQLVQINEQYKRLQAAAQQIGVEIFNLSQRSRLTAFPKISHNEFAALPENKPETIKKSGALNIVSYATTPVAGVPAILARCINHRTEHSARCVWATNSYGNAVEFTGDVEWQKTPDKAETLISAADLIIVHNGKIHQNHEKLIQNKAILTMAHNYLWNVDRRFVAQGFPGAVVAQYQAALPEFEKWSIVPNPIPHWESEYQPAEKPARITVCYTPSGKHDVYPRDHRLYWHSKGYDTTIKILKNLAGEFAIELEIIGDKQIPHLESLRMKQRAHIVIDECVTGSYHRNSLEGLAAGCAVINGLGILPGVSKVFRSCVKSEKNQLANQLANPFAFATLDDLAKVLQNLIESGASELVQTGLRNRRWLEENWNFREQWQRFWSPLVERALRKNAGEQFAMRFQTDAATSSNIAVNAASNNQNAKFKVNGVSVVVPHGGQTKLPHLTICLANLRQCSRVAEIIIVELGEISRAAKIAAKWADKYVFARHLTAFERAKALNIGSEIAEGEQILWLDNDLLMPPDFVERAAVEMSSRQLDFLKPYTEIRYLSQTDSQAVMRAAQNPDQFKPANVFRAADASGGAGIVSRDFFEKYGGMIEGFAGWGGEDNGWIYKVHLLGKSGSTNRSDQTLYHLHHQFSGGYGGEAHRSSNPLYQANLQLLNQIKNTGDKQSFIRNFPAQKHICSRDIREADAQIKQMSLITPLSKDEIKDFAASQNPLQNLSQNISENSLQNLAEQNFSERGDAKEISNKFLEIEILPQPIYKPNLRKSDLPIWLYWEGACADWIRVCQETILAKAPTARILSWSDFDQLWDSDRDLNLSRLHVAHRADFARAFLLQRYGGLWIDSDCILMQPLDDLLGKLGEFDFLAHRERSGYFSNGFIGAKPDSRIAQIFYQRICKTLRSKQPLGWMSLGGQPLTETLKNAGAPLLELDCRQVQPICWSHPEKFFTIASESAHEKNFDREAVCYMLSNNAVRKYQAARPAKNLLHENSFFSFLIGRSAQNNLTVEKVQSKPEPPEEFISSEESAKTALLNQRCGQIKFFVDLAARLKPAKVLDLNAGFGRAAFLLRELFEKPSEKQHRQIEIQAVVNSSTEISDLHRFLYDNIQVSDARNFLLQTESNWSLIIVNYNQIQDITKDDFAVLSTALEKSDYVLLDCDFKTVGFDKQNESDAQNSGVKKILNFQPQVLIESNRTEHNKLSQLLLSRSDPLQIKKVSDSAKIFTEIYRNCAPRLDESASGPGSNLAQTEEIRRALPILLDSLDANFMLDIGCGDFFWLSRVHLGVKTYIGVDVVPQLVEQLQTRFGDADRNFIARDSTTDLLPSADVILCRDCLVLLSNEDTKRALRNFCNSASKYLLATTFPNLTNNRETSTGVWRPLNLQLAPFNLPAPLLFINERCTEAQNQFADKSLGLWRLKDLQQLLD